MHRVKITTYLWFDNRQEAKHYNRSSGFQDPNVFDMGGARTRWGRSDRHLQLEGQEFIALPAARTRSPSHIVARELQNQLRSTSCGASLPPARGGTVCWLKTSMACLADHPSALLGLLRSLREGKRVMDSMLLMKKIDVARLEQAWRGVARGRLRPPQPSAGGERTSLVSCATRPAVTTAGDHYAPLQRRHGDSGRRGPARGPARPDRCRADRLHRHPRDNKVAALTWKVSSKRRSRLALPYGPWRRQMRARTARPP